VAYLTNADLVIEADDLTTASGGSQGAIDRAIGEAEAEARTYLDHHFDVDVEFAKTGTDRSTVLVSKMSDMAIFHLYKAMPSDAMPERRLFFYQEAQGFLDKVKNGKLTLDVAAKTDEEGNVEKSHFLSGSNTKIQQHGY